jgi:hypothetical protein
MPNQLYTYYMENHLVMLSRNSGNWRGGCNGWLEKKTWVFGKGISVMQGEEGRWGVWEERYEDARFGGPHV